MIKLSLIPLFLFAFTGLASSAPDGNLSPTSDEAKEVAQHWLESFADGLKQSGAKDVKVGKIGIEDEVPLLSPSSILPPSFRHDPAGQIFARNITGRYRGAQVHPLSLSSPPARTQHSSYWSSLNPPFNTNLPITPPDDDQKPADKWRWQDTTRLDMSFIETAPIGINHIKASSGESPFYSWGTGDWLFAEGSLTLTSASPALLGLWNNEDVVRYDFYGMHYIPNGTINLYALPRGKHILPITSKVPDWGQGNILDGLVTDLSEKMDVKKQLAWYSHVWFNTPFDIEEKGLVTECPLSIHITFPPSADLAKSNITSTNTDYVLSSPRLAGVAIAEGCGWALGFEGGGFFEPTSFIRYQNVFLIITYLVAGLKPFIRAPGTIVASVPTLTTWFMLLADCLVMLHAGGHGIREKIGKEEVMVVMIYLASQCCVTLFEYNEFCAGYWPHVRVVPSPLGLLLGLLRRREEGRHNRPWVLPRRVFFQWLIVLLPLFWVTFPYIFSPRIFPLVLFAASSFWTPSILSSAFTGVTYRWNWQFVLGQTIVRSGLLLYMFAWEKNPFLTRRKKWVWIIVSWQVGQIWVLYQQTRRRPDFFLPKSMALPRHNYQPTTVPALLEEKDYECPICYEIVYLPAQAITPMPSSEQQANEALALSKEGQGEENAQVATGEGEPEVALRERGPGQEGEEKGERDYAITPCNHVYHMSCMKEVMKVHSLCPLCQAAWPSVD